MKSLWGRLQYCSMFDFSCIMQVSQTSLPGTVHTQACQSEAS